MTAGAPLTILALGKPALTAAQIIAARRAARIVQVAGISEAQAVLEAGNEDTLLVADLDAVRARELLALAHAGAARPSTALAVLYARGAKGLTAAAMQLPGAASIGTNAASFRLFSMLGHEIQFHAAGLRDVRKCASSSEEVVSELEADSDFAMLIGHSSGMDMSVGGALLCVKPAAEQQPDGSVRAYPCYNGGPCARHAYGVTRGESVVAMSKLGARRVIWLGCYGAIVDPGLMDERLMMADGLARSNAQSFITTLRATAVDSTDAMVLYAFARMGLPFGEVANRANRHRLDRGLPADFICFGDPATRLAGKLPTVAASSDGEGFRFSPPLYGQAEYLVTLPRPLAVHEQFVVLEPAHGKAAVLSQDSLFFSAVTASEEPVRFAVGDARALVALDDAIADIAAEVPFLRRIQRGAAARIGHDNPAVDEFGAALEALTQFLETAKVPAPVVGGSMTPDEGGALAKSLSLHRRLLALHLSDLYLDLGSQVSSFSPSTLWQLGFGQGAFIDQQRTCSHCGNGMDVMSWRGAGGRSTRQTGYCHACGPTLDGPDVLAIKVQFPSEIRRGACGTARVQTVNTGTAPAAVTVTAMLPRFVPDGVAPPHRVDTIELLAVGEAWECTLDLEVPRDWVPGIHFACLMQVVDARVSFARLPVMILP